MKFGINFFPTVGPHEKSGAAYYDESLELCVQAERLGFDFVKTVEHYFFPYGGYSPDPVAFLTAAAVRTRRLRLVTGAVLPAFTHPVKLASQLAMLDNISHGRLDVGCGRAFLPDEFDAFQVPLDESRERFEEGIAAIEALWANPEAATFQGRFHQFGPLRLLPPPYQKPHPPLYVAAARNPETCAWAGSRGYHLMLVPYLLSAEGVRECIDAWRSAWAGGGRDLASARLQLSFHAYLAEDDDTARREARVLYEDYNKKFEDAVSAWGHRSSAAYPEYEKLVSLRSERSFERRYEEGNLLVGSPKRVAVLLDQARDRFGDFEASLQVSFSTATPAQSLRTIELLAAEVMPRYRAPTTSSAAPGDGGSAVSDTSVSLPA